VAPVLAACVPESASPAHLYRAAISIAALVEHHSDAIERAREDTRDELAGIRESLQAVLAEHENERGQRRVWQLLAAAVPTVLIIADLVARLSGWLH
jgi:hypothetical protein